MRSAREVCLHVWYCKYRYLTRPQCLLEIPDVRTTDSSLIHLVSNSQLHRQPDRPDTLGRRLDTIYGREL